MKISGTILFLLLLLFSGICTAQNAAEKPGRYLALGDSYTAGYLVAKDQSLPYQLASILSKSGFPVTQPQVIAHNGWNSRQLLDTFLKTRPARNFDLVTLFIGVNNQYKGYALPDYERDMVLLIREAIRSAAKNKNAVYVIGIPDWSITPFGAAKSPQQMALEIADFNQIAESVSRREGVHFISLFSISQKMQHDPEAVAPDQLHPTAKTYTIWATYLAENILAHLKVKDK